MDRWRLSPEGPSFTTKLGSHLAPVLRNGVPAMLKIASGEEEERGAALMEWWGGVGAARVLERERAALLLERVTGRRSLATMALRGQDDAAMRVLCRVAAALHEPRAGTPPSTLVPLDTWFRALAPAAERHGGVLLGSLEASHRLLASPREIAVLHGDIHHDNVLDGGARGWLAIDPKGLIGERGFDYANMLCNPWAPETGTAQRLRRRVALVARQSRIEPRRILMWLLAWAGLSASWTLADGEDASPALRMAELARTILADG
ncbi:MAG: aminoglycoside phosphotransferase family protein [Caulobacteraceae bacterium]